MQNKENAYLVLEDGAIYKGYSFGSGSYTDGEVVFNTGITGYQEVLTDPSYSGQIVIMTFPQIGNYGFIKDDVESGKIQVRGFVVREYCDFPNNYRSESTLGNYLKKNKICGIQGIDTRALTKRLRSYGTMRGFITSEELSERELKNKAKKVADISKMDLVSLVTVKKEYSYPGNGLNIGIIDYGMKFNMARILNNSGNKVTVLPAYYSSEKILLKKFDLLLLSNGPGDPMMVTYGIKSVKELLGKIPIAGICLGHQILGLALGGTTYKLKFGHRGGNHPVKNLIEDKVWITTQNHGYAVDKDSLPKGAEITHINLNDNTVEGFLCKNKKTFSVQFHPEAAPGPLDCNYIFDDFIKMTVK